MSAPKYDWEAESAARVARMKREQEERAQRYLDGPQTPKDDVAEAAIAWVLVAAVIFVIAALAAGLWFAGVWLFRD